MSHEPKLEIYKLKLINKSDGRATYFRNSFRKNVSSIGSLPKPINDTDIYREYFKDFLNSLDLRKGYKVDGKKSKAFKIASDQDKNGNEKSHISSPLNNDFVISGILEGGKHNIKRWLGDVNDPSKKSDIHKNNVVGDRFFFLLYTPINHHTGILLIQGYTEVKISDVFRDHIIEYFKVEKEIDCKTEIFIPEKLKDKYLKSALFKSAKFSSGFILKNGFDGAEDKDYELEVKIEIIDKSDKKTGYKSFNHMLQKFGNAIISLSESSTHKLDSFKKKSAKMVGKGKEFPIDFDNEDNIKPVILLVNEGIKINEGQIPDFGEIETYCRNLLNDIINEINPENAITDI